MVPITIEGMKKGDIDEILEIEKTSFPSPWTREAFLTEIKERNSSSFLVAKNEGRIVGYAGFWLIIPALSCLTEAGSDEAHITNLAVHPEYRKKKIGERLMRFLLKLAVAKGAKRATLEVRPSNIAAQNLYKKFGFKVGGIQKGYYEGAHLLAPAAKKARITGFSSIGERLSYYSDTGEDALIMRNRNLTAHLFPTKRYFKKSKTVVDI